MILDWIMVFFFYKNDPLFHVMGRVCIHSPGLIFLMVELYDKFNNNEIITRGQILALIGTWCSSLSYESNSVNNTSWDLSSEAHRFQRDSTEMANLFETG